MNESESITISVNNEPADFRRILWWYRWKRTLIVLAVSLVFVVPMVFNIAKGSIPVIAFTFAFWLVFVGGVLYWGIRNQANKATKAAERAQVTFDSEGYHAFSESVSSSRNWSKFEKVVETSSDFVFFPQENIFYPIPKRFFESEDQIERLKVLLRAHVGDRAKLKSSNG